MSDRLFIFRRQLRGRISIFKKSNNSLNCKIEMKMNIPIKLKTILKWILVMIFTLLILTNIYFPLFQFIVIPDFILISKSEYAKLRISIVSAFLTFLAILVALFKDDLRERYKRPKLSVEMPEKLTIETANEVEKPEGNDSIIEAEKYISRIEIRNNGNVPAINVEISLEKLVFQEPKSGISESKEISTQPLPVGFTNSNQINIKQGSKKVINIVQLFAPERTSLPDGTISRQPARILIGDYELIGHNRRGTWTAEFAIFAENHKMVKFIAIIEWKCTWKPRIHELLESSYKIEIQK